MLLQTWLWSVENWGKYCGEWRVKNISKDITGELGRRVFATLTCWVGRKYGVELSSGQLVPCSRSTEKATKPCHRHLHSIFANLRSQKITIAPGMTFPFSVQVVHNNSTHKLRLRFQFLFTTMQLGQQFICGEGHSSCLESLRGESKLITSSTPAPSQYYLPAMVMGREGRGGGISRQLVIATQLLK